MSERLTSHARRTRPLSPLDPLRPLDDPDGFVSRLIRKKAASLARRPEFLGTDPDDLAQDLACDLVKRLPRFNPRRGRFTTFLFRVLRRETADLVQRATARKRRGRRPELELGETPRAEADLRRHRGVARDDAIRDIELRDDVACVTESLSPHLQERCAMLMVGISPAAIAKAKGIPPEAVREDLERIRRHFVDHDLDGYL